MEGGSTYIPRGLRMAADRLTTFSRNRFKIMPSGSDSSGPNRNSTFVLPSASLVDLHSFKVHATIQTNGVSNNADTVTSKLPGDSASLIHRFTVSANGTQLSQGTDSYHTVARILKLGGESRDKDMSVDNTLGFSQIDDTAAADHVTMVFSQFLGLFSQASVRYLDTSLVGSIQTQITWAGPEVLIARGDQNGLGNGHTANEQALIAQHTPNYTVESLYATIDTISIDQLYGDLLRKRLSETGYISILMKEYYTFQQSGINTTAASMRFALSSGSIDKVYVVLRDDNYATQNQDAHEVLGAALTDALVAPYFRFQSLDSEQTRDGSLRYQFTYNGVSHPQYLAGVSDACYDLSYANNLHEGSTGHQVSSRLMFNDSCAIFTLLLDKPDEPVSIQSGADSRGVSSQFDVRFTGLDLAGAGLASVNAFAVACCNQEVRIGQGLSVAVAH